MDKTLKQKLEMLPIKNIDHPVGNTKYYAAVHVKSLIAQADEEISTLKKQLVAREKQVMELKEADKVQGKEIVQLKSQLQQQALPVVPECVGEWIEILKTKGLKPLKNPETYGETGFTEEKLQNIVVWIFEHQEDYMRAWLDGYTIEKPQLFYLVNTLTRQYLYRRDKVSFGEQGYCKDYDDKPLAYCLFTKQEIDSMQTGSYEQIEVTE
ncbi:DUF1642 domain-containing protein [Lactococcus lactis]|uniref:DUF1642 domain-containing protein n=1 Tax=Lactococcus lactis TaxID=1358 RepID=UPI0024693656|nr:DUF1642 domain-containing protein [Lactococcus lactis]MDH5114691.1 DUF1642 domain-containing protein [Lactococcus lactis]